MCSTQMGLSMGLTINRADALSDYGGTLKRLQWQQVSAKLPLKAKESFSGWRYGLIGLFVAGFDIGQITTTYTLSHNLP